MGSWKKIEGEGLNGFVKYFTKLHGSEKISNFFIAEGIHDTNGWGPASTVLNYSSTDACSDQYVTIGHKETAYIKINFRLHNSDSNLWYS